MSEDLSPLIHIHADELLNVAHLGARRASAFVTIAATREKDAKNFTDFSLGATSKHSFWPSPVAAEAASVALEEFDSWILGSALRELHSYFELFLNQVWNWSKAISLHGARLPSDYVLEDVAFRDISSVKTKLQKLASIVAVDDHWLKCISSMHFARNCLSHGAGYVRARDCTDGSDLCLEWTAMDVLLVDGLEEIPIDLAISSGHVVKSSGGAQVIAKKVLREKRFAVGERLLLANHELAEICTFYTGVSGLICNGLIDLMTKSGIPVKHA